MLSKVKSWFKREPWVSLEDHDYMVNMMMGIIQEQRAVIDKLRAAARATVRTGSTSAVKKPVPAQKAKPKVKK